MKFRFEAPLYVLHAAESRTGDASAYNMQKEYETVEPKKQFSQSIPAVAV